MLVSLKERVKVLVFKAKHRVSFTWFSIRVLLRTVGEKLTYGIPCLGNIAVK